MLVHARKAILKDTKGFFLFSLSGPLQLKRTSCLQDKEYNINLDHFKQDKTNGTPTAG